MQLSSSSIKTVLVELIIVIAFISFLYIAISNRDSSEKREVLDTFSISNSIYLRNN